MANANTEQPKQIEAATEGVVYNNHYEALNAAYTIAQRALEAARDETNG